MNGKLYFFGVTKGLTAWPIPPEQRYFDRFYQSDKTRSNGKTEFIVFRDTNGRVSYNWLQYGNMCNCEDRHGSFFGMSLVLNGAYCYDVVGLRQYFSRVFNEAVKDNHAVFMPSANSPSSVRFVVQSMENLGSVIEEVERAYFSDISAFDVRAIDSSFKSGCDQGVRMEVGNNNDDALDALRQSYCVAIPTSGNRTDRKEIISKFNPMLLADYYQVLDFIRDELKKVFKNDDYDSAKNLLKLAQNSRIEINTLRSSYKGEQIIDDLDSDFMSVEKQLSNFIDSRWASQRNKYNQLLKGYSDLIVADYNDAQAHKLLVDVNSMISELEPLCQSNINDNTVQQLYKDIIGLRTQLNNYIKPKPVPIINPKYLYIGGAVIALIALILIFKPSGDNSQPNTSLAEQPKEEANRVVSDDTLRSTKSDSIDSKINNKIVDETIAVTESSEPELKYNPGGEDEKNTNNEWQKQNKPVKLNIKQNDKYVYTGEPVDPTMDFTVECFYSNTNRQKVPLNKYLIEIKLNDKTLSKSSDYNIAGHTITFRKELFKDVTDADHLDIYVREKKNKKEAGSVPIRFKLI